MFKYERLWQVLVSIQFFKATFWLKTVVVILKTLNHVSDQKCPSGTLMCSLSSWSQLQVNVLRSSASPLCSSNELASKFLVVAYRLKIQTGKKIGAGTDANVYCTIFGDNGDSGMRKIRRSDENRNKFERGEVCFSLSLCFWEQTQFSPIFEFACSIGKWGKKIEIYNSIAPLNVFPNFSHLIHSQLSRSHALVFKATISFQQQFFKKSYVFVKVETCIFECVDLGKLSKVRIEHDNKNLGAGWYLDQVSVQPVGSKKVSETDDVVTFPCHRYVSCNSASWPNCFWGHTNWSLIRFSYFFHIKFLWGLSAH